MLSVITNFISDYLLILMGTGLSVALLTRYASFRASRDDEAYYSKFVREVNSKIQKDTESEREIKNVDTYIEEIINYVKSSMPKRKLRDFSRNKENPSESSKRFTEGISSSVSDYVGGENSLFHGLVSESTIFKGHHPPNFREVTHRIMSKDLHWQKLYGFIDIDKVARLIDALPSMFIVLGIFGTFLGISAALPQIAEIDFNNFDGSSNVLSKFVLDITFAMKTSIAGIICSLTLSLVNTLFPITKIRDDISDSVESTIENMWYFIQGETPEKKRDEVLTKILFALQQRDLVFKEMLQVLEKTESHLDEIKNNEFKKSA